MTKAVLFPIPFVLLLAASIAPAQNNSYSTYAVNQAVMRQADAILLRQKLAAASAAVQQRDLVSAAKLYEDAYSLVQDIGGQISIPRETAETISGLAATHMELAREALRQGDLHEADVQVLRVLAVDPQNPDAIALKKQIDQMIYQMRGQRPDMTTLEEAPVIQNQKMDAATLARDGQMLYEMGKLEEAEAKLEQALQLDPGNRGAYYYLNLVKQARFAQEDRHKNIDNSDRMVRVEKAWEQPVNVATAVGNPYFMTNLVYSSPERQTIYSKLSSITFPNVSFQSLPLSEVIDYLRKQTQIRDPQKEGINFNFNPTVENIPSTGATTGQGGFRGGGATTINPATGLPEEQPSTTQPADDTQININLTLNNVSLADLLNAICLFSDHPIKYSVEDYGVVFAQKGPDSPQYEMRTFKVDPNTFYSGLQNVSSYLFGSVNITSGTGGGSSGNSGGNGQTQTGAVVPVVNAYPGASSVRGSSGGGAGAAAGGGGGGGGVGGGGVLQSGLNDLNSRVQDNGGGLLYVTTPNLTRDVSALAKEFFTGLGLDLSPPKQVYFNDRLGVLFVYATPQDLDIIERAIQVLNESPPMVHIKARFIDVTQNDNTGLGFDWYLGQFNIGNNVVGQGGAAGSLAVPVSAGNSSGTFPGSSAAGTLIPNGIQSLTSGLNNGGIPSIATITGILTNPNFQVVLHALEQRSDAQELAEPEVTTISGRQVQMRATVVQPVVTGYQFQAAPAAATAGGIP